MQSSESIFRCFTNFTAAIVVIRFRSGITEVFTCNLSQLQESL